MNDFHCVYHSVSSAMIDFCFDVYICEGVNDLQGGGEREGERGREGFEFGVVPLQL